VTVNYQYGSPLSTPRLAQARIAGVGGQRASTSIAYRQSVIAGVGNVRAAPLVIFGPTAGVGGRGLVRAFATVKPGILWTTGSFVHGAGGLHADATITVMRPATALLTGAGGASATTGTYHQVQASAAIHGAGGIAANTVVSFLGQGAALLAGGGAIRATAARAVQASARIDGIGAPRGQTFDAHPGAARIAGQGSIRATASADHPGNARITGSGATRASGYVTAPGAARIGGVGAVHVSPLFFVNNNGLLQLAQLPPDWPTSPASLPPGAVWSDDLVVAVVPGATPNPNAPPLFYSTITPARLLAIGGGNLPLANPNTPDQLWNDSGTVARSS
jgi:hypothetical protein